MQVPLIGAGPSDDEQAKRMHMLEQVRRTFEQTFPSAPSPMADNKPWWQGKTLHDDVAMTVLTTLLANDGSIKAALADQKFPNDNRMDNYCRFSFEMASRFMAARETYFILMDQAWKLQAAKAAAAAEVKAEETP